MNLFLFALVTFRINISLADDATFFIKVNPAGTYLRTDSDDKEFDQSHYPAQYVLLPEAPTELDLTALYNDPNVLLEPGDYLSLEGIGDFKFGDSYNSETGTGLIGVFSGDNGFISPGPGSSVSPIYTVPSYAQGLITDIAEDFKIPKDHFVIARIPENATKILFSVYDSNFANNTDPNHDFGVNIKITVIKAAEFNYKQKIISDGGRKITLPPPTPPLISPKSLDRFLNTIWPNIMVLVNEGMPLDTAVEKCLICGDPVNVVNGILWHNNVDIKLAGRTKETTLQFQRTYLAHPVLETTMMGAHWFNNFQTSIYAIRSDGEDNLMWVDEKGGSFIFTRQDDGTFISPSGFFGTLSEYDDKYEIIKANQTKMTFSRDKLMAPYGKLLSISEPHGEEINLTYDKDDNLISADTKLAGKIKFTYNKNKYLTRVTNTRDNLSYDYAYDSKGNLILVTDFSGYKTSYSYLNSDKFYLDGLLQSMTDPIGRKHTFNYSYDGRIISETEPGNATRNFNYGDRADGSHITEVQETDGNISFYIFDINFHLINSIAPDNSTFTQEWNQFNIIKTIDQMGAIDKYDYDQKGNLISIQKDSDSKPTFFTYDSKFNKPLSIIPALGAPTKFVLDANNGDILEISRTSQTESLALDFERDQFGNIISTSNGLATYGIKTNLNGQSTTVFDSRNPQTLSYDSRGRVNARKYKNGRILTYSYDNYNRLIKISDSNGPAISNSYDIVGRLISKEIIGTTHRELTKYLWDVRDRILQKTDAIGRVTKYKYDNGLQIIDKPILIISPNGKVTSFEYNNVQKIIKKTDANGAYTKYNYNLRGDLELLTDALGNSTNFQYDGSHRLLRQESPTFVTDSTGRSSYAREVVTFKYDDRGKMIREERNLVNNTGKTTAKVFIYDPFDRLVKKINQKINQQNTIEQQDISIFTYAPILETNLIKNANNSSAILSFSPEAFPPYKTMAYSIHAANSTNKANVLEGDFIINRDFSGEISKIQNSNGEIFLASKYDPSGRLLSISSGNFLGNKASHYSSLIQYDDLGRKIKLQNSTGHQKHISYDDYNRITSLSWEQGPIEGSHEEDRDCEYEDFNISEQLSYDLAGNIISNKREHGTTSYKYDEINQLISEQSSEMKRKFQYDLVGNRVNDSLRGNALFLSNAIMSDNKSQFFYDEDGLGSITTELDLNNDQQKNYKYDINGRIASTEIEFADYGRNSKEEKKLELLTKYSYDALGRRISKVIQNSEHGKIKSFTQSYAYLGAENKILLGRNGDGEITLYVDGLGVDEHFGEVSKIHAKSYITDHLGSVLNTKARKDRKTLDAFGNSLSRNLASEAFELNKNSEPVIYGFAGRELDIESGLYFNRNRMYNPEIGRFMSKDPIGLSGGDLNMYRYVGNNPQNYTDPDGKCGLLLFYIENPELAQELIDDGYLYASEFYDGLAGELGGESSGLPPTTAAGAVGTFIGKGIEALDGALDSIVPASSPEPLPDFESPSSDGEIG